MPGQNCARTHARALAERQANSQYHSFRVLDYKCKFTDDAMFWKITLFCPYPYQTAKALDWSPEALNRGASIVRATGALGLKFSFSQAPLSERFRVGLGV